MIINDLNPWYTEVTSLGAVNASYSFLILCVESSIVSNLDLIALFL